jgi:hypothetical protein
MLWLQRDLHQIIVVWYAQSNSFLNYFLNARFYWKNPLQSDERVGKTAHDLGSDLPCPRSGQPRLKSTRKTVDN